MQPPPQHTRLALLRTMSLITIFLLASWSPSGTVTASKPLPLIAASSLPATLSAEVAALQPEVGPVYLMLELVGQPALLNYHAALQHPRLSEAQAIQIGMNQVQQLAQAQDQVLTSLEAHLPEVSVLYHVSRAYNGIAVIADANQIPVLRQIPGIRAIHALPLHEPHHAGSVPLIGAPQVWQSLGLTGSGIKLGIIDSGIDYVHAMFGGSGSSADLTAARSLDNNLELSGPSAVAPGFAVRNTAGDQLYPNAKVVGGFDFAGDTYNAGGTATARIPRPDANPMDCPRGQGNAAGHGSHVAGTAAGYGVNPDGTTYAGPWDSNTPFEALRIAPGVAPQANLYALRVFGCNGSTALTTLAIDWAVDPNGDGDFSDRLDVINMSLGSAYGSPDDPTAQASDNAAAAGVIVVVSAGNSGDTTYILGSPGSSARAITVASSVDATDVVDGFQASTSTGSTMKVASFSVSFNWAASDPLSAPLTYDPTFNGCTARPAGTFAGQVVLVDWAPAGTSNYPCGSSTRANHAQNAGAVGIIMASGLPFFDATIAGNTGIRAVYTTFTVGQELKDALATDAVTITFSYAFLTMGRFVRPEFEDTVSRFTSRGPRSRDNLLKPDLAAPGQSIFSASAGTGSLGTTINGTSMATPHVTGMLALLRQRHPTWSVAELKALIINTARNDLYQGVHRSGARYAPQRVGAGRVDGPTALANQVIAFDALRPEAVHVSFGFVEVPARLEIERIVRVVNKGSSAVSYTLGYDPRTSVPGVSYSFPDGTDLTVPAGGRATVRVRLSADPSQMTNAYDPTSTLIQANNPRHWLNEAAGLITLTPSTGIALRLPVHAIVRPASQITTLQTAIIAHTPSLSSPLTLVGTTVGNGVLTSTMHNALTTAFELQATSPQLASLPPGTPMSAILADLQHIGVTTNASRSMAYFALTTWHDLTVPASDYRFEITIDCNDDGSEDFRLFTSRLLDGSSDTDVLVTQLVNLTTGATSTQGFVNIFSADSPTALMNTNVLIMPVKLNELNMPPDQTHLNYYAASFSRQVGSAIDIHPPFDAKLQPDYLRYDLAAPGVSMTGAEGLPLFFGQAGQTIMVDYNAANYLANNSQGVLLLHHYNQRGSRAQVVPIVAALELEAPPVKTYGEAPFVITATASLNQDRIYSSTTPEVCTVTGHEVTLVRAGDCVVRATTVATSNFGSTFVEQTIAVTRAPLTITAQPATRTYGAANPPFTVQATGFVNNETLSDLAGTLTLTSSATTTSSPGEYPITVGGVTSTNYDLTFVPGTLTVTRAPLMISVNDAFRPVGIPNPEFSATITGLVNDETEAVLSGTLSFTTTATIDSPPGVYSITASGLTSDNYAISYVAGTLYVGRVQHFLPLVVR